MDKIKIGQIGVCHEHAAGKMNALRLRPDIFEIVGVVDDRDSKAAKFAGSNLAPYEGLKWLSEDELFSSPGLQAVVVEVPNLELVSAAFRCLEHNLPIHMDKPGGDELEMFGKLRRGYEEHNLPFQMGYMFRNNPAMQWIREAAHKGYLGEIFEIQASMSHNYGGDEYQEYLGNFSGGIMFNLGCHLIDFVVSLLGRPTGITPFLKSVPGYSEYIKNNGLAVLEYPHATATLRASSAEVDGMARRWLKVCGTKGTMVLCPLERFDGQPLHLDLVLRDGNEEYAAGAHALDFGPVRDRYEDQLLELVKMIRGEMPNHYDYKHDYLVQEVLLSASGYTKWVK